MKKLIYVLICCAALEIAGCQGGGQGPQEDTTITDSTSTASPDDSTYDDSLSGTDPSVGSLRPDSTTTDTAGQ
jgi:hypothetical protein